MIKHLNLTQFESRDGAQECSVDTHTLESRSREWILYSQGETERLNSPKSIVCPFDENRHMGKADGTKS